jgi:subtilase family serine protease
MRRSPLSRSCLRRRGVVAVLPVAIGVVLIAGPAMAAPAAGPSGKSAGHRHGHRVCTQASAGGAGCFAEVVTDDAGRAITTVTPQGFGPADLQSAYALAGTSAAGRTVAIVDAYDDPNAASDLSTYRSTYGLPACTTATGCFVKVNQTGGTRMPAANGGWAQEISLDLDMVSAVCPSCKILLVEANSASFANLGTAVDTAVRLGAAAVSNSYGGSEFSTESSYASHYNHPGVAITASSGDAGYGVEVPAAYSMVTAVGGTSLTPAGAPRGWTETVWPGSGSGCSAYIAKPSWQTDTGCAKRTVGDVSAVADPNTGVAVFDSYRYQGAKGWMVFGGTSVASPIIASVYALGNPSVGVGTEYSHLGALNDVVIGSNGNCPQTYLCTAGSGYDGPTGLGTPAGVSAF